MRKYVLTRLLKQFDPRVRQRQCLLCLASASVLLISFLLIFKSELPHKELLEILLGALLVYSLLQALWLWQFRYLAEFIDWNKVHTIADWVYDYPGETIFRSPALHRKRAGVKAMARNGVEGSSTNFPVVSYGKNNVTAMKGYKQK